MRNGFNWRGVAAQIPKLDESIDREIIDFYIYLNNRILIVMGLKYLSLKTLNDEHLVNES